MSVINTLIQNVQAVGRQETVKLVENWCEKMDEEAQEQGEEINPELKQLFHTYLESVEEPPKEAKGALCVMYVLFHAVQTKGKQRIAKLVEKWYQKGIVADPQLKQKLLTFIENIEKEEGEKKTN